MDDIDHGKVICKIGKAWLQSLRRNFRRRAQFYEAISQGRVEEVKAFLVEGIDTWSLVNERTLFHFALDERQLEVLAVLLSDSDCRRSLLRRVVGARNVAEVEISTLITSMPPTQKARFRLLLFPESGVPQISVWSQLIDLQQDWASIEAQIEEWNARKTFVDQFFKQNASFLDTLAVSSLNFQVCVDKLAVCALEPFERDALRTHVCDVLSMELAHFEEHFTFLNDARNVLVSFEERLFKWEESVDDESNVDIVYLQKCASECWENLCLSVRRTVSSSCTIDNLGTHLCDSANAKAISREAISSIEGALVAHQACEQVARMAYDKMCEALSKLQRGCCVHLGDELARSQQALLELNASMKSLCDWKCLLSRKHDELCLILLGGKLKDEVVCNARACLAKLEICSENVAMKKIQAKRNEVTIWELAAAEESLGNVELELTQCLAKVIEIRDIGFPEIWDSSFSCAARNLRGMKNDNEQNINSDLVVFPNRELGRGATSRVLEGFHSSRGRVAVKILPSTLCSMLKVEVDALRLLDEHPNVVSYYAYYETPLNLFLVLALCAMDLSKLFSIDVTAEQLDLQRKCLVNRSRLLLDICCGVTYLHKAMGYTHRDLKPGNVLIDYVGNAKLSDFGTAKCKIGEIDMTSMSCIGTIGWRAPEMIDRFSGDRSSAADVFSVGLIAFFLFANGVHPFGVAAQVRETNIKNPCFCIPDLEVPSQSHFVKHCVAFESQKRLKSLVRHPVFWSDDECLHYLKNVWESTEVSELKMISSKDWQSKFVDVIPSALSFSSYKDNLFDLLRAIRNIGEHAIKERNVTSLALKSHLGLERSLTRHDIASFVCKVFPTLVLECFDRFDDKLRKEEKTS
jgi:serine/threonine protein kinase